MVSAPPPAVALVGGRRVWWTTIRRRSLIGLGIFAPLVLLAAWELSRVGFGWLRWAFAPLFVFAYIMSTVCLVMLVLGRSPGEIDNGWHDMVGWKRLVASLVLVGAAILLVCGLGGVIAVMAR